MTNAIPEYIILQRLDAYPDKFLKLGYYLEQQPFVLKFYEIHRNFFQYLDLNYYFFANHPNSRVGVTEIEKFPYILLPFFIYGLYKLFSNKNYFYFVFLVLIIIYYSLLYDEVANPILIYPFIIYAIYKSIKK